MRYLLDTHLLLWAAGDPDRLSDGARELLVDPENVVLFSVASIWEATIKASLGRRDFALDVGELREGLRDAGYLEVPVLGEHALGVTALPALHRDPFDRLLVAQARHERVTLVTSDRVVASYGGSIVLV